MFAPLFSYFYEKKGCLGLGTTPLIHNSEAKGGGKHDAKGFTNSNFELLAFVGQVVDICRQPFWYLSTTDGMKSSNAIRQVAGPPSTTPKNGSRTMPVKSGEAANQNVPLPPPNWIAPLRMRQYGDEEQETNINRHFLSYCLCHLK